MKKVQCKRSIGYSNRHISDTDKMNQKPDLNAPCMRRSFEQIRSNKKINSGEIHNTVTWIKRTNSMRVTYLTWIREGRRDTLEKMWWDLMLEEEEDNKSEPGRRISPSHSIQRILTVKKKKYLILGVIKRLCLCVFCRNVNSLTTTCRVINPSFIRILQLCHSDSCRPFVTLSLPPTEGYSQTQYTE